MYKYQSPFYDASSIQIDISPSGNIEVCLTSCKSLFDNKSHYPTESEYYNADKKDFKKSSVRCIPISDISADSSLPASDSDSSFSKRLNNLVRARTMISILAKNNPWEVFATITLSPEIYGDRSDLKRFKKELTRCLNILSTNYHIPKIPYLIVFEPHHTDLEKHRLNPEHPICWHAHCLFGHGILQFIEFWDLKSAPTKKIRKEIKRGKAVGTSPYFSKRFGFTTFKICDEHSDYIGRYLSKYVSKDFISELSTLLKPDEHIYYRSQGLKTGIHLPKLDYIDLSNEPCVYTIDNNIQRCYYSLNDFLRKYPELSKTVLSALSDYEI